MTTADDRTERPGEDAGTEGAGAGAHPFGPELGPLVDEVRRFAGVLGQKAQEAGADTLISLSGLTDRLRERQPEVYSHLLAAGGELLAAYRAAVSGHERRWTAGESAPSERIDLDGESEGR